MIISTPQLLTEAHHLAVARLFAKAFGQPLGEALWRWKYAPGRGESWGIWAKPAFKTALEGFSETDTETLELVAHFGAFPRRAWYRQRLTPVLQLADVMADPASAAGLSPRQRPIAYLARHLLTTLIGPDRPYRIGFGFPNERAYRYFARLGYYAAAGTICQATAPATADNENWQPLPFTALSKPQHERWLAAVVRDLARHHLILDRTYETYCYRYYEHPEGRYRLWWHPKLEALAVTAPCREAPQKYLELLDLVALRQRFAAAWRAARALCAVYHLPTLTAWVSDPIAALLAHEATLAPLGITIPTNALAAAPSPETLRYRWWLMGGDSDFR